MLGRRRGGCYVAALAVVRVVLVGARPAAPLVAPSAVAVVAGGVLMVPRPGRWPHAGRS
jgi:hypothetical protein